MLSVNTRAPSLLLVALAVGVLVSEARAIPPDSIAREVERAIAGESLLDSAPSAEASFAVDPELDPGAVLLTIGDSVTNTWVSHAAAELQGVATIHNTAWNGMTANEWWNVDHGISYPDEFWQLGWQGAFGPDAPAADVCTIGFATNEIVDEATALVELGHALSTFVPKVTRLDPAHPLSLESATNWQRRIAEECLGRGAEVVFLRPIGLATGWRKQAEPFVAWVGFEFQRMDRQIRGLAKDLRVTLVRISVAPDRYWTPTDPFHPSTLGRATIARRIAKKIKRILRTR